MAEYIYRQYIFVHIFSSLIIDYFCFFLVQKYLTNIVVIRLIIVI